jgi:hypothetical protein
LWKVWYDHHCALVARAPGLIPGSTRISEKWVWNGGPLSLVGTIEKLLGRKSSGSVLENREYGSRDPLLWPRDTLYP